ncbi:hypothetical protein [Rickettsia endosymbiont of Cardiosporidium cionae]|uniref:hypothetical protein n=1 Tax=Rickettsia endosymbiont of Cardiosporidium cionae TaxID=2777155 RepID=UPI0018956BB1|nr:hypothetical protein [Rickettsia endosymbiont of Cardiosporidium cionae]KAF8818449.1 hypothetical protein IHI24_000540 [Rickettsia endosymbiont of Cardiosporidium cionae]
MLFRNSFNGIASRFYVFIALIIVILTFNISYGSNEFELFIKKFQTIFSKSTFELINSRCGLYKSALSQSASRINHRSPSSEGISIIINNMQKYSEDLLLLENNLSEMSSGKSTNSHKTELLEYDKAIDNIVGFLNEHSSNIQKLDINNSLPISKLVLDLKRFKKKRSTIQDTVINNKNENHKNSGNNELHNVVTNSNGFKLFAETFNTVFSESTMELINSGSIQNTSSSESIESVYPMSQLYVNTPKSLLSESSVIKGMKEYLIKIIKLEYNLQKVTLDKDNIDNNSDFIALNSRFTIADGEYTEAINNLIKVLNKDYSSIKYFIVNNSGECNAIISELINLKNKIKAEYDQNFLNYRFYKGNNIEDKSLIDSSFVSNKRVKNANDRKNSSEMSHRTFDSAKRSTSRCSTNTNDVKKIVKIHNQLINKSHNKKSTNKKHVAHHDNKKLLNFKRKIIHNAKTFSTEPGVKSVGVNDGLEQPLKNTANTTGSKKFVKIHNQLINKNHNKKSTNKKHVAHHDNKKLLNFKRKIIHNAKTFSTEPGVKSVGVNDGLEQPLKNTANTNDVKKIVKILTNRKYIARHSKKKLLNFKRKIIHNSINRKLLSASKLHILYTDSHRDSDYSIKVTRIFFPVSFNFHDIIASPALKVYNIYTDSDRDSDRDSDVTGNEGALSGIELSDSEKSAGGLIKDDLSDSERSENELIEDGLGDIERNDSKKKLNEDANPTLPNNQKKLFYAVEEVEILKDVNEHSDFLSQYLNHRYSNLYNNIESANVNFVDTKLFSRGVYLKQLHDNIKQKPFNKNTLYDVDIHNVKIVIDHIMHHSYCLCTSINRSIKKIRYQSAIEDNKITINDTLFSIFGRYYTKNRNFIEITNSFGLFSVDKLEVQNLIDEVNYCYNNRKIYSLSALLGYEYLSEYCILSPICGIQYTNLNPTSYKRSDKDLLTDQDGLSSCSLVLGSIINSRAIEVADNLFYSFYLKGLVMYQIHNSQDSITQPKDISQLSIIQNKALNNTLNYNLDAALNINYYNFIGSIGYGIDMNHTRYTIHKPYLKITLNI